MSLVAYGFGLDSTLGGGGTRITLAELTLDIGEVVDVDLGTYPKARPIKICYARGDTAPILFAITLSGAIVDITGYTFQFTVNSERNPVDTANEKFSIAGVITDAVNGELEFRPSAVNTDLASANYYYDVSMVDTGGFKTTVAKASFIIEQDIDKS